MQDYIKLEQNQKMPLEERIRVLRAKTPIQAQEAKRLLEEAGIESCRNKGEQSKEDYKIRLERSRAKTPIQAMAAKQLLAAAYGEISEEEIEEYRRMLLSVGANKDLQYNRYQQTVENGSDVEADNVINAETNQLSSADEKNSIQAQIFEEIECFEEKDSKSSDFNGENQVKSENVSVQPSQTSTAEDDYESYIEEPEMLDNDAIDKLVGEIIDESEQQNANNQLNYEQQKAENSGVKSDNLNNEKTIDEIAQLFEKDQSELLDEEMELDEHLDESVEEKNEDTGVYNEIIVTLTKDDDSVENSNESADNDAIGQLVDQNESNNQNQNDDESEEIERIFDSSNRSPAQMAEVKKIEQKSTASEMAVYYEMSLEEWNELSLDVKKRLCRRRMRSIKRSKNVNRIRQQKANEKNGKK